MWLLVLGALAAVWVRGRHFGRSWFDQFELDMMGLFAQVWHRCRRCGPCPLPPSGPAILIANHNCHADPAFLIATCPRLLSFLQAKECFAVPVLWRLFRRAGCIPVARDGRDVAALRQSLQRLRAGGVLAIFPEGSLERDDLGRLGPARLGAAYLALKSRVPVYPAFIVGGPRSRQMLRSWLWPSRAVRVTYGPAIDLSPYYGRPLEHALAEQVTDLLMRRLAELAEPALPLRRAA